MFHAIAIKLLFLLGVSQAVASNAAINVPSTIVTNTNVKMSLNSGALILQPDPNYMNYKGQNFSHYRVYLSYKDPEKANTELMCTLFKKQLNSSDINGVSFVVGIPASIGPSGSPYNMAVEEYIEAAEEDPCSGDHTRFGGFSNDFSLSAATAKLSRYESDGNIVGDYKNMPCTALGCARNCTQTFYPPTRDSTDPEVAAKEAYDCISACPGVTYKTGDQLADWRERQGKCDDNPATSQSSSIISRTYGGTYTAEQCVSTFVSRTYGGTYTAEQCPSSSMASGGPGPSATVSSTTMDLMATTKNTSPLVATTTSSSSGLTSTSTHSMPLSSTSAVPTTSSVSPSSTSSPSSASNIMCDVGVLLPAILGMVLAFGSMF